MSEADGRLADVLEGHWSLCHHCSSRRVKVILLNKQGILITDAEKKRRREEDDDRRQSDLASSSAVAALSLSLNLTHFISQLRKTRQKNIRGFDRDGGRELFLLVGGADQE